jgi:hypothetical protein
MALAMHYEQIPDEQWKRIEARLNGTIEVTPPEIRNRLTQVIECITEARRVGAIDRDCVVRAQSMPPQQTSSVSSR